ncbi:DUF3696 domain-containing protein [Nonomuraea sp. NPDC048882]|uniref:AAA family ATPase n=1 Tax=Nonomuraea sp. NPDC048882 TaxID=3154347 RepID=UPI0033D92FAC
MITHLSLKNFKAWEDSGPIKLGSITAFFGSNSSGKTSFLQSLLLMKQTIESADRGRVLDLGGTPSALVNLGTFEDVIFQHDRSRAMEMALSWAEGKDIEVRDPEETSRRAPIVSSRDLSLSVRISEVGSFPAVEEVRYGLGDLSFSLSRMQTTRERYELTSAGFRFKRATGRAWPLPPPGKFYSFPDEVRAYFRNASFLSDLELRFENLFSRVFYLGPMRQDPERQYIWSGGRPVDVGRRGEFTVDALIASQTDGKVNSRGFVTRKDGGRRRTPRISMEQHVAEWLTELGLISAFEVRAVDERKTLYRVNVRRGPGSPSVLLTDVGFGVSQVLPVLVLLAYAPEGSTVLLEQPEIHLHPAVQAALADIIIEAAKARGIQIIMESHSEHLLMRLQRRIAEQDLDRGIQLLPEDCELYFCDFVDGSSRVERLRMDKYGNIANWPKDFFGDSLGEAAATTRAARKRAIRERSA